MSWLRTWVLLCALAFFPLTAVAQSATDEASDDGVVDASSPEEERVESPAAGRELKAAEKAIVDERWDDALQALERAYLAEPDAYYLYRRILVLEEMGEFDLALTVLTENRTELAANQRVKDVALIEERLRAAVESAEETETNGEAAESRKSTKAGPSVPLLAGGGVLVAGGIALMVVGTSNARAVRCSLSARPDGCQSESDVGRLSADEFQQRGARANALFSTGVALTAAGAALGVIAFVLSGGGEDEEGVSILVTPSGQVGLQARW